MEIAIKGTPGLIGAAAIALLIGAASLFSLGRLDDDADWVGHTREVQNHFAQLLSELTDAETGQRGYLLTGQDEFLHPYRAALAHIDHEYATLRQLTADNPEQQRRLAALRPLLDTRLDFIAQTLALQQQAKGEQARQLVASGQGKRQHDRIRQLIQEMTDTETTLLAQRRHNSDQTTRWTQGCIVLGNLLSLLLIGLFWREVRRELQQRLLAEQHLLIVNRELEDASARARQSDQMKSAFLATMSHELRTPLNSIIGFSGILRQELAGPLNAEQAKQLDMVQNSARHLLSLINDVLDISKIEAGEMKVAHQPYSLRSSIDLAIASVAPLAAKKSLSLSAVVPDELAPQLATLTGDARRVQQILINLLSNAIKFTQQGSVTLSVAQLPGQPAVCIRVTDTGSGIKPQDLENLFKPFHQVDTGLARQYEGTGLGLAICQRLAHLLGGEIEVASVWQQGSTFSVTLPFNSPEVP